MYFFSKVKSSREKGSFEGCPSRLKDQIFYAKEHVNCAKISTHHYWPKEDGHGLCLSRWGIQA